METHLRFVIFLFIFFRNHVIAWNIVSLRLKQLLLFEKKISNKYTFHTKWTFHVKEEFLDFFKFFYFSSSILMTSSNIPLQYLFDF